MIGKQSGTVDIVAVAKAAGVSISTVSRSYNHPDLVKPATRRRIEKAIEKLGYIRNRAAQSMHGRRSATIGLVVPTINHTIFSEVIQAFSDAVDEAGFTILMATHRFDLGREYAVLRKLLEHRVDGIALTGLEHAPETYRLLEQQEIPSLAIWSHDAASVVSCVGANNAKAGRQAARHILQLGHRRIGLLFPPGAQNDRARHRYDGVRAMLGQAGVAVDPRWEATAPYSIAQAKAASLEMLGRQDRPTALICGNDVIAQGAIYAAMALGLAVPRDLSIIGIGDFPGSAEMEPALTTVRIPARRIGRTAGQLLAQAIMEPDMGGIVRREFDLELMVRASTAAIPAV